MDLDERSAIAFHGKINEAAVVCDGYSARTDIGRGLPPRWLRRQRAHAASISSTLGCRVVAPRDLPRSTLNHHATLRRLSYRLESPKGALSLYAAANRLGPSHKMVVSLPMQMKTLEEIGGKTAAKFH